MTDHTYVDGGWRESRAILGYWLLRCSCGFALRAEDVDQAHEMQERLFRHIEESVVT